MRALILACVVLVGCAQDSVRGTDGLLAVEPIPAFGPDWSVTLLTRVDSPVPEATGITFDGTQVWLIGGAFNGETHRLVRYDYTNSAITREFTLVNLIEVLGTGAFGLAWDGAYIWIAVTGNRNKVVAVDPDTGEVVRTWATAAAGVLGSLSFDGTSLWLGGNGRVESMDLVSGAVLSSFSTTPAIDYVNGLVTLTGQVLTNDLEHGFVLFTTEGQVLSTNPTVIGPMCLANNRLIGIENGAQLVFYDVDPGGV